jgi:L-lysine 2,3-aminomutase
MSDSLDLKQAVRGQIVGFLVPKFILDLPAEGGKRLTRGVESYDRHIGLSKLTAPGLKGEPATMQ